MDPAENLSFCKSQSYKNLAGKYETCNWKKVIGKMLLANLNHVVLFCSSHHQMMHHLLSSLRGKSFPLFCLNYPSCL